MPPALDLVVLGDANPDLVLSGGDVVPAFGQAEHLVDDAHLTVGGSGGILACGAARLGLNVAFCGVVGNDLFGRFMCDAFAERGIDTRGLLTDPERPTGLTVVISAPGDRAMLTHVGTVDALRVDQLDQGLLTDARHVHVSSYFLQRRLAPDLPDLFERLHEHGVTTSIDPNWDPGEEWDGGLLALLMRTNLFFPNTMEATRVARISDLDEALQRLSARAELVVVKNGERGATAAGNGEHVSEPGFAVRVLDTTGAGDSFDAGFLAAWLADEPLSRALAIANACGALSTRKLGGVDAQPTMEEALHLVERSGAT
jgi:sugar/nucleoside kinase (ribokinase family)